MTAPLALLAQAAALAAVRRACAGGDLGENVAARHFPEVSYGHVEVETPHDPP